MSISSQPRHSRQDALKLPLGHIHMLYHAAIQQRCRDIAAYKFFLGFVETVQNDPFLAVQAVTGVWNNVFNGVGQK